MMMYDREEIGKVINRMDGKQQKKEITKEVILTEKLSFYFKIFMMALSFIIFLILVTGG